MDKALQAIESIALACSAMGSVRTLGMVGHDTDGRWPGCWCWPRVANDSLLPFVRLPTMCALQRLRSVTVTEPMRDVCRVAVIGPSRHATFFAFSLSARSDRPNPHEDLERQQGFIGRHNWHGTSR